MCVPSLHVRSESFSFPTSWHLRSCEIGIVIRISVQAHKDLHYIHSYALHTLICTYSVQARGTHALHTLIYKRGSLEPDGERWGIGEGSSSLLARVQMRWGRRCCWCCCCCCRCLFCRWLSFWWWWCRCCCICCPPICCCCFLLLVVLLQPI